MFKFFIQPYSSLSKIILQNDEIYFPHLKALRKKVINSFILFFRKDKEELARPNV